MQANLKIKYMDGNPSSINLLTSFNSVSNNNVSDISALENINIGKTKGMKPFVLGASTLAGGDELIADKYCGFMSDVIQNSTPKNPWFYDITISTADGTEFDAFVILFDEVGQQWATKLYVDPLKIELDNNSVAIEKTFVNDGPKFVWKGAKSKEHRIHITKWNKPKYPVRITGFVVGGYGEYDEKVIQELNRSCILIDNNKKPYYSITSGYGRASLFDDGRFIADVAEAGAITRLSPCNLVIGGNNEVDIISGTDVLAGAIGVDMEIDTWEYSFSDSFVKIDMVDKIEKLHSVDCKGISWGKNDVSALDIFNGIISEISSEEILLSEELEMALSYYRLKYYNLPRGTAYEALTEICTLTQTILFTNGNGKLELVSIE